MGHMDPNPREPTHDLGADVLAQPKKCQDREDHHNETDEIDNIVHAPSFRVDSRSTSRYQRDVLTPKACSLRAPARRRPRGFLRVLP